ncbi:hypothetical protein ACH5RR_003376 [Cinchona calisaya]|uniref:Uncharacterized protein n=1 Tax=Cinchona calisaya TaxID=153742 RepID=A0ABD3AUP9_9GENT
MLNVPPLSISELHDFASAIASQLGEIEVSGQVNDGEWEPLCRKCKDYTVTHTIETRLSSKSDTKASFPVMIIAISSGTYRAEKLNTTILVDHQVCQSTIFTIVVLPQPKEGLGKEYCFEGRKAIRNT